MPHSPFTRFYGLVIVAACFLALLWPDDHSYILGWQTLITAPLLIGIFTWSVVRHAAPFDDLAFHRTLPPGDGFAFRRVLGIHGLVVAGLALAMVTYCWSMNFGWRVMSYGILVLTLPAWALMAASGIAASLSSTRQWGRTWGYLAIFVVPVFSATWILFQRPYFDPEAQGKFYLSAPRTMALAGALLYPLVWWLVSVKRRRGLGFGLGAAISALIPWIYIYGGFFKVPERDGWEPPVSSHVTISRNAVVPAEGKWLPVEDVISISGLRPGEFINHWGFSVKIGENKHRRVVHWEVPDDPAQADTGAVVAPIIAGRFEEEKIVWGERAVWNHLRQQIPSHEAFGLWNGKPDVPTHLAFLRPGEVAIRRPGDPDPETREIRPELSAEEFTSTPWQQSFADVFRLEKVGEIDAANGGTCRLPGGGILKVSPLQQQDTRFQISFRQYFKNLWHAEGTWFEADDVNRGYGSEPWVIAVDESGKQAFVLSPLDYVNAPNVKVLFAGISQTVFNAGEAKTREQLARMEMLRHCRLHVFWPRLTARLGPEVLPPPQ